MPSHRTGSSTGLRHFYRRWLGPRRLLAASVLLPLIAWGAIRFHIPTYKPAVMKTFSSEMRTHCVGRYLIDLPVDLGAVTVEYAVLYFGMKSDFKSVEINVPSHQPSTYDEFWKRAIARRDELARQRSSELDIPMLVAQKVVESPNGRALLVRRLENEHTIVVNVTSELHAFVGGRYVILKADSFPPENEFWRDGRELYKLADPAPAEARLAHLAQEMRSMGAVIGNTPGFCIAGVVFDASRMGYTEEKADFEFDTNEREVPFLSFELHSQGRMGYGTETLHERMDDGIRMFKVFGFQAEMNFRALRRTERKIEGVTFQEWGGEVFHKDERTSQYAFMLQNMRPGDPMDLTFQRPAMDVSLTSGEFGLGKSPSPYTEQQVETAWDQWVATLRLSPGNGGKASRAK